MSLLIVVAGPLQDVYESDILAFHRTRASPEFSLGHILTKLLHPHEYIRAAIHTYMSKICFHLHQAQVIFLYKPSYIYSKKGFQKRLYT